MTSFNLSIFKELKGFLQKTSLNSSPYTLRAQDFSRKRKLDFSTTFLLILSLLKKPAGRAKSIF
jgi:hypothetical protein